MPYIQITSAWIEGVGGVKAITEDVSILAAAYRNLEEMVKRKMLREDLRFRYGHSRGQPHDDRLDIGQPRML
jgi:DNA-binding NtrC family response regulator